MDAQTEKEEDPFGLDGKLTFEFKQALDTLVADQVRIKGHLENLVSSDNDIHLLGEQIETMNRGLEANLAAINRRSSKNLPGLLIGSVALYSVLLLLSIAASIYSLNRTIELNLYWEEKVNEKIRMADDVERSINFFKALKEASDAGQSD